MQINASKIKVISVLIPSEQRQTILLDAEPLEDFDKLKDALQTAALTYSDLYSLSCNPVFGRSVKYRQVQRKMSIRK